MARPRSVPSAAISPGQAAAGSSKQQQRGPRHQGVRQCRCSGRRRAGRRQVSGVGRDAGRLGPADRPRRGLPFLPARTPQAEERGDRLGSQDRPCAQHDVLEHRQPADSPTPCSVRAMPSLARSCGWCRCKSRPWLAMRRSSGVRSHKSRRRGSFCRRRRADHPDHLAVPTDIDMVEREQPLIRW